MFGMVVQVVLMLVVKRSVPPSPRRRRQRLLQQDDSRDDTQRVWLPDRLIEEPAVHPITLPSKPSRGRAICNTSVR